MSWVSGDNRFFFVIGFSSSTKKKNLSFMIEGRKEGRKEGKKERRAWANNYG